MTLSVTQFLVFIRNVMVIPAALLPDSSLQIQHAYDQSLNIVNQDLGSSPSQATSWSPYELAVYNLGGHLIIEWAVDVSYPLAAVSWVAGMANATTSAPHMIQPGDKLAVVGVSPYGYSGPPNLGYVVAQAVPDNTHFSYALTNPGPATLLANAAANELYFVNVRKQLKITSFAPGVITSAGDLSTSAGLLNPEFMRTFTLEDLQLLKTQQGRTYLSIAQKYGPTAWGVS